MFDADDYLKKLIAACRDAFRGRFLYAGLQGSYLRGEATDGSDIDVMIILEDFSVADMDVYREILQKIGHFEKSCGFICGRSDIERWSPLEVCQLYHTTGDLYGRLKDFLPPATREDEINYVKLSLGNLYHELCQRYIHADREKNRAAFRGSCKFAFFLIQNLHYLESGSFALTKRALKEQASAEDGAILDLTELPDDYDFDGAFSRIFRWCQQAFIRVSLLRGETTDPEGTRSTSCPNTANRI